MNHATFFSLELNFAALGSFNSRFDVHGHGANFRVRHQVARTQNFTQTANDRHHVRGGNAAIEFDGAALNGFHQVLCTNDVCTSSLSFFSFRATSENSNAHGFTGAVRQADNAADHLVSVTGVNTQRHCDFDGFVEFGFSVALNQSNSFFNGQVVFAGEGFASGSGTFSQFCHLTSPQCPWSGPNPG